MVSDDVHCVPHSVIWFLKIVQYKYNFETLVSLVKRIFFLAAL